ncbi:Agamous-like MADS-box protein AGL86 [Linum perenne]
MGRKKVQHELISNEITRKITFKKRKMGLLKKLEEITTLCGVIACGIILHKFNGEGKEDQPEVWPSMAEATDVLKKFKGLPQKKKGKHMLNHETLLDKSLKKMTKKLNEEIKKNTGMEMELLLMEDLPPITEEDLNDEAFEKLNFKREILNEMINTITECIENFQSGKKNI